MKKIILEFKFNECSEMDISDEQAYLCFLLDNFKGFVMNPLVEEVKFYEI